MAWTDTRRSRGKMRTAPIVFMLALFLASPVFAQDISATNPALSACGPADVKFDVKVDQNQSVPEPPSDKALVYVIEDTEPGWITSRIGLDGAWIGANHGNTHFSFSVLPGEHHLCSNWQSSLKSQSSFYSLANFTAEAGKVYYFRTWIAYTRDLARLDLEAVNSDEGRYLVAASALATSHPKK
jgi:hypothetical protein